MTRRAAPIDRRNWKPPRATVNEPGRFAPTPRARGFWGTGRTHRQGRRGRRSPVRGSRRNGSCRMRPRHHRDRDPPDRDSRSPSSCPDHRTCHRRRHRSRRRSGTDPRRHRGRPRQHRWRGPEDTGLASRRAGRHPGWDIPQGSCNLRRRTNRCCCGTYPGSSLHRRNRAAAYCRRCHTTHHRPRTPGRSLQQMLARCGTRCTTRFPATRSLVSCDFSVSSGNGSIVRFPPQPRQRNDHCSIGAWLPQGNAGKQRVRGRLPGLIAARFDALEI
jgi:hypothetical protein